MSLGRPAVNAVNGARRPSGRRVTRVDPVLQPDPGGTLTEGVVVRTTLVARLLGLRLLRIDGTVLIAPGRLGETTPRIAALPVDPYRLPGQDLARAGRLLEESHRALRRLR